MIFFTVHKSLALTVILIRFVDRCTIVLALVGHPQASDREARLNMDTQPGHLK